MSGLDPVAALPSPSRQAPTAFRGRVTEVYKDASKVQYAYLFRVAPLVLSSLTGAKGGEIDNVILRVPGLGSLDDPSVVPSGIIFLPEVGSIVHVERYGTQWVITGFYTGPVRTALETANSPRGKQVSFNSAPDRSTSNREGIPGWQLPHWSGELNPGGTLIGRRQARVYEVPNQTKELCLLPLVSLAVPGLSRAKLVAKLR